MRLGIVKVSTHNLPSGLAPHAVVKCVHSQVSLSMHVLCVSVLHQSEFISLCVCVCVCVCVHAHPCIIKLLQPYSIIV